MTDPFVTLPSDEFEELLERASEKGARRALSEVGLDGPDAGDDIRELRGLLSALKSAKKVALTTVVKVLTTGLLLALMAGVAIKVKLFGGQ